MRNHIQSRGEAIEWSENDRKDVELRGVTLAAVAGSLGVHRATVSRRLRRETGWTWREHKSRHTEEEAKRLLSDPRRSVKEVAFILEFCSGSAFSRFFLRRTGVRPSKWCVERSTEKK